MAGLIEEVYGVNANKVTRFAIKKDPKVFHIEKLKAITEAVSKDYDIKLIYISYLRKGGTAILIIRPIKKNEIMLLTEFLYEAIFRKTATI